LVFDDEIDEVIALIAENPAIGVRVHVGRRGARRLTMERTRYYIYYDQVAEDSITILALWHASRARNPML
jgi:plasmid stabilization system protein ParE